LDSREDRNIFELEMDKILSNRQLSALKALNFFSSRSFSFTVPVGGKGFINLFFRLLDFFSKNAEML
jgi:hypothetical protein